MEKHERKERQRQMKSNDGQQSSDGRSNKGDLMIKSPMIVKDGQHFMEDTKLPTIRSNRAAQSNLFYEQRVEESLDLDNEPQEAGEDAKPKLQKSKRSLKTKNSRHESESPAKSKGDQQSEDTIANENMNTIFHQKTNLESNEMTLDSRVDTSTQMVGENNDRNLEVPTKFKMNNMRIIGRSDDKKIIPNFGKETALKTISNEKRENLPLIQQKSLQSFQQSTVKSVESVESIETISAEENETIQKFVPDQANPNRKARPQLVKGKTKIYGQGKNKKLGGLSTITSKGQNEKPDKNMFSKVYKSKKSFMKSEVDNDSELKQSRRQGMDMFSSQIAQKSETEHEDLRGVYIDNYGVKLEFPAYYHVDAKFVPSNNKMVVTMGFHIIPKASNAQVQSTYQDGRIEENSYDEIYSNTGDSILLTLCELCGRSGFKKRVEVQLTGIRQAIMEFSNSGKYFGLLFQNDNSIHVFDSSDIHKCFQEYLSIEKIKDKSTSIMSSEIKDDQFQNAKRVIFDSNDKYVAVLSATKILIFNIETGRLIQNYKIELNSYESINDIVIDSNQCANGQYDCVIACKCAHITQIHVFDINNDFEIRAISYLKKGTKLTVKISDNLKQVIISNGQEHYIHTGDFQQIFPWIKDKFVRKVVSNGNDFYLITSKDYDRDIDILHSGSQSFNASVSRSIEPGLLIAFDAIFTTQEDEHGDKKQYLKTLIKIGDYLYQDTIDVALCNSDGSIEDFNPEDAVVSTSIQKFYSGYGFNWPYFSYATQNKKVLILNCFNPNFVQRYEFPAHITVILQTFLTDTHDFYAIVETQDEYFETYHIDLDQTEPRLNGPIIKYSFKDVNNELLIGFHARASSHKEKINLNKSLMFFMTHGNTLWAWKNKKLTHVEDNVSNLKYLSDDQMFFMTTREIECDGKTVEHSSIKMIDTLFGSYKITEVYCDKDHRAEILNFGVDNTRKRLIILTGIKNHTNKRDKFITFYDVDSEKIIYHLMIKNREIIGRLKSNLYNYVEGHIYYGNKVIKVRFDQLERLKGGEMAENQLFDHYSDILQLNNPNNEVQSGTPLQNCMYNRLAYIIRNGKELKARKILVMPYLHDRRIYLNRRESANQFYSLVEHSGQKFIYCMCIDANKIYVYTDTGILVDRIQYKDVAFECGSPQELSENARFFVFRKGDYDPTISLIRLELDGLKVLKSINIKDKILNYILNQDNRFSTSRNMRTFWETYLDKLEDMNKIQLNFCMNDHGDILVRIKPTKHWLEHVKKTTMDQGMLAFQHDRDESNFHSQVSEETCSLFYYICNFNEARNYGDYIYFDSQDDDIFNLQGVSMNSKFVFFWNLGKVWRFCLKSKELTKLSLYISEKELQTSIKQVRTGSNENLICVRVTQSPKTDCIIVWDLQNDLEQDAFDVQSSALFFQDRDGNPYVAEKDYIINCTQGCKLKCYNLKVSDFELGKFGFMYGHRVNMDSHNYIIFRNWINLSFSYMTFVIKDNFDKSGYVMDDYLFDPEGYDYILKKKNIFFEGDLVKQQYEKLNFILKNYKDLDPVLLESLQYKNEDSQKIPLHLALEANNNRMVNLILNNMAKIDFAAVDLIKDVFSNLIEYQNFERYLKQSPFQSVQMLNKSTLKLKSSAQEDEEIIIVRPTKSSYVDEDYFKKVVGELDADELESISDRKTFAVKIECVKADWIINEEVGLKFLKEMLRTQNKDVFVTKYIQIIVQFLYNQFKSKIMTNLMPFYLMQLALTMVLIGHSASFPDHLAIAYAINKDITLEEILVMHEENAAESADSPFNLPEFHRQRQVLIILISILNVQSIYIFIKQTIKLKHLVFKRMWSLIDMIIITCNLLIFVTLFYNLDEIILRVVEAILIVFLLFKSLYFLRFVGEIAPLVDIIFVIMADIQYFMVIFLIAEVAFITAFFCIGRNQRLLKLIEINNDPNQMADYEPPNYSTLIGAIDHVYLSSLGEFDSGSYFDNPMTPILFLLFVGLSFFMCIHLLNMLIAIMGESFAKNNEVKEAKKKISQLQFVVENWWLDPIQDKKNIVYLVAAFNVDDEDQDEEKFEKINDKVDELSDMQMNLMMKLEDVQVAVKRLTSLQQQKLTE